MAETKLGLTGRPSEASPAHEVDMQVEDGLATVRSRINDSAIAAVQTQHSGNFWDSHQ